KSIAMQTALSCVGMRRCPTAACAPAVQKPISAGTLIAVGQTVWFRISNGSTCGSSVDPNTRTTAVRVATANPGGLLNMNTIPKTIAAIALAASLSVCNCFGQSLGNAGTIQGTVVDPSGASVAGAVATLFNPVSGYKQSVVAASDGSFRLVNIPPNPYRLEVTASGFDVFPLDVSIKNAIPIRVKAVLAVAGGKTTVTVEAAGADILENDPSAHVDVDRSLMMKLPVFDPGAGLSEAI